MKTALNIFPFKVKAYDLYYAHSPQLALSIWKRHNKNTPWYACDFEAVSPYEIVVSIYGIGDGFRGGIGNLIKSFTVSDFTPDERELLDAAILNKYTIHAEEELEKRLKEERIAKVLAIRAELFGV